MQRLVEGGKRAAKKGKKKHYEMMLETNVPLGVQNANALDATASVEEAAGTVEDSEKCL